MPKRVRNYSDAYKAREAEKKRLSRAAAWPTCKHDGCEGRIKSDNKNGYCQSHKTATSRSAVQLCQRDGCSVRLMAHNQTGYCVDHGRGTNYSKGRGVVYAGEVGTPFTRNDIWIRDRGICYICQEPADENRWHLEHVFPRSKGGKHVIENVRVAHPLCNGKKYNKIINQEETV